MLFHVEKSRSSELIVPVSEASRISWLFFFFP